MPRIAYESKTFNETASDIITKANRIVAEYAAQGFNLTLRQLYYQFVSRDWFPERWADPETGSTNNEKSYKKLGDIISDARMCGLMDWESIIDRTRSLRAIKSWKDPASIVGACANQFRLDLWSNQPCRPEVWVEKDAAIGVVEGVCDELRVPHFSCRGYTSQSAMWEAAQRLIGYRKRRQQPFVIHLGDHDPSGIDMSRDIQDRLHDFMTHHGVDAPKFVRIALNRDQVDEYQPPPNPTKITDSRSGAYIAEHGHECWELDALEPSVVADLIRHTIGAVRLDDKWDRLAAQEGEHRKSLGLVAENWTKAVAGCNGEE